MLLITESEYIIHVFISTVIMRDEGFKSILMIERIRKGLSLFSRCHLGSNIGNLL